MSTAASHAQAAARAPGGARRPSWAVRVAPPGMLLWAVSACALAFLVLPTLFVIVVSFGRDRFVSFPPDGLTLVWFGQIDPMFWSALWFSVQVAVVAVQFGFVIPLWTMGRFHASPIRSGPGIPTLPAAVFGATVRGIGGFFVR